MKRRDFIAGGIGLAASFHAGAAAAETLIVHSPGDGYLNLRTGPGTRYDILRAMAHGSRVETLEWAGHWVRVRHESGDTGWCSSKFLARQASRWRYVHSAHDGYLNLRRGPGTRYAIKMRMYNNERVEVLESSGKWLKVRHESGTIGWAYSRYLLE